MMAMALPPPMMPGPIAAGAPMPAAAPAGDGKLSHVDVHYGMGRAGKRCDGCRFYHGPNDCEIVQPPIYPAGVCDKFSPAAGADDAAMGAAAQPVAQSPMMHGRAIAGAKALHAVGHITGAERDKHIGKSQAVLRNAGKALRKPFGSFSP